MKYTIELNEQDLKEILASRFGVEEIDVVIEPKTLNDILKVIITAEPDLERMYR
jgi:hypothetical protein